MAQSTVVPWQQPAKVNTLAVVIRSSVADNCWPQRDATRAAVERVFRNAGLAVFAQTAAYDSGVSAAVASRKTAVPGKNNPTWPHAFTIELLGYKAQRGEASLGCVVHIGAHLERVEVLGDAASIGLVHQGWTSTILTAETPDAMQELITRHAVEAAISLANARSKARIG